MNFSGVDRNGLEAQPNWLSLSKYEAESTVSEKVTRVANNVIFAYGAYVLAMGETEAIPYISYLSLGLALRKAASTAIGYLVYPAALTSFSRSEKDYLIECGNSQIRKLERENFIVRKISLYKSGTRYAAVLITHSDTIQNGNWTMNALGNGMTIENSISDFAKKKFANNCSTLLINGPSVGQSGGWPTRYQMGAGFEAGIRFLESEVKATHIIMRGLSLGGGMMGEAILNHDFTEGMKRDIRYLFIADCSFSRLSTVAGALVGSIVKPIFYVTGTELDGVEAARKLSRLGIQQIIIQHTSEGGNGNDGVIPDSSSLAYELHKNPTLQGKTFLESESIPHNVPLPKNIEESLNGKIHKFVAKWE